MKKIMPALAVFFLSQSVNAACYGTGTYKRCTDESGNNYTVSKSGNTTRVNGYNSNTGNSWNQTSRKSGNATYQTGTDAQGRYYNNTIRKNGSNTTYSGTDSDGNSYYKNCNKYGCY